MKAWRAPQAPHRGRPQPGPRLVARRPGARGRPAWPAASAPDAPRRGRVRSARPGAQSEPAPLIGPETTVVEASSGSTAVSEAYFARLIGVPFVAVMSRATSPAKIALIKREGGNCHLIDDPAAVSEVAARLAAELDGHFLDQFTYAERATDWRGNNNIAEATLAQMALEPHRIPILDRRRCRNRRHRGGVCAAWGVSARPSTGTNVFGALPSPARRMPIKQPEPSSRSCATAAPGIPPHTMTTSGSRNKESTSALTCPWSNGPGKTRSVMARTRFDVACPLSVSVLS